MPVTTAHVSEEAIEAFKDDVSEHPAVERVSRDHGRAVKVHVKRGDNGTPTVYHDVADRVIDGRGVTDEWVAGKLAGSGLSPGNKYTYRLCISAPCAECGDRPGEREGGICRTCERS